MSSVSRLFHLADFRFLSDKFILHFLPIDVREGRIRPYKVEAVTTDKEFKLQIGDAPFWFTLEGTSNSPPTDVSSVFFFYFVAIYDFFLFLLVLTTSPVLSYRKKFIVLLQLQLMLDLNYLPPKLWLK